MISRSSMNCHDCKRSSFQFFVSQGMNEQARFGLHDVGTTPVVATPTCPRKSCGPGTVRRPSVPSPVFGSVFTLLEKRRFSGGFVRDVCRICESGMVQKYRP